ncbi:ArnT family glycosyltransferase [Schlesneria paludicola]|uniref:ArnT family glycosyltransferase n=1 Tax=Schlesneria paludicola TaxID=360056 RepID=UPI000299EDD3|nr:phospholipid carrier-dependent glycosyltransferase [Schlesneria paludicola]
MSKYVPVVVLACLIWLCIAARLDPGGSYPRMPQGPGLTVDEVFNVQQGVYLIEQARVLGWLNLVPGASYEAYRAENGYNPDHPPLGRWWLGMHHHLAWWLFPPFEPDALWNTACARSGSATALALTIILVGGFVTSRAGWRAGLFSALALVSMPRVFGHAHLASLESITNFTCTVSVLVVAHLWNGPVAPTSRRAVAAGVILGLALMTKIQAVLIPIPVICWVLWRWRARGLRPLMIWGGTAIATFFLLWPYLWDAPLAHGLEYLGRATNRATIYVWYWGQRFTDKEVPWHYPFVIFGLTVPVMLHLFGVAGVWQTLRNGLKSKWRPANTSRKGHGLEGRMAAVDPARQRDDGQSFEAAIVLILACALFPLVVFAVPGVAVYDGERLFLTSFPLWAILIGIGAESVWSLVAQATGRMWIATSLCCSLFAVSAWPLVGTSPCHLVYENGLSLLLDQTADRSLFEVDYWGEGVTRELLFKVTEMAPQGATIAIAPALHQFQTDEYLRQSPILRSHGMKVIGYDSNDRTTEYVLVFRRMADLPEEFLGDPSAQIVAKTMVGGRLLAYLVKRAL